MLVVHVHVRVKPGDGEAFKAATLENARQSVLEPGIARFELLEAEDDPTRFVLVEVFRTAQGPAAHKQTVHYAKWRDTVEPMMAVPRRSDKQRNIFPVDDDF
jgi:(4S)-4-hydroxy-5-phosphonooxypentane-2,3-dione isomerase